MGTERFGLLNVMSVMMDMELLLLTLIQLLREYKVSLEVSVLIVGKIIVRLVRLKKLLFLEN